MENEITSRKNTARFAGLLNLVWILAINGFAFLVAKLHHFTVTGI